MNLLYAAWDAATQITRNLFQKRIGDGTLAYLGDKTGEGARTDVPGRKGYVYVRFPNGRAPNGERLYTAPTMARVGNVAFQNYPGAPVYVAVKYNNELEIVSAHYAALDQAGIDTSTLNPLNQQSKWVYPFQLTYGLASAVATTLTDSALVMVKKFRHYDGKALTFFETPLEADKIDLSPYIPGPDEHCYAAVWIDTYLNEAVVVTSIPQPMDEPLDDTDLQETVKRAAASRPPDATPLKAFHLKNDQASVKQSFEEVDTRLWLYNPPPWGFPNVLDTLERVQPNRTLVIGPYTTTGVGDLAIEAGAQVIIAHKSHITASAPTISDDETEGYSVGSQWFDTADNILYFASDVSTGAAVWESVAGDGGSATDPSAVHVNVPGEIAAIAPKTALVGADKFIGEDSEDFDAKFSTTMDDIADYIGAGVALGAMLVQDQKTSGTNGGGFTSGADQIRTLNTTVSNTITGASLGSNQITLPAGQYRLRAVTPAQNVNAHQAVVYNVTTATVMKRGITVVAASNLTTLSEVVHHFTLTGTEVLEIRHRCGTTNPNPQGFGVAGGFGIETYTSVEIVKEA